MAKGRKLKWMKHKRCNQMLSRDRLMLWVRLCFNYDFYSWNLCAKLLTRKKGLELECQPRPLHNLKWPTWRWFHNNSCEYKKFMMCIILNLFEINTFISYATFESFAVNHHRWVPSDVPTLHYTLTSAFWWINLSTHIFDCHANHREPIINCNLTFIIANYPIQIGHRIILNNLWICQNCVTLNVSWCH